MVRKPLLGWVVRTVFLLALLLSYTSGNEIREIPNSLFQWSELSPLPLPDPTGTFIGVHNDALIVAGGSTVSDDIYVLQKIKKGEYSWLTDENFKLPRFLSDGAAITTDIGIICAGGRDSIQCYSDVYLITWNSSEQKIEIEDLPSLPRPLVFMSGTKVGHTIYLVGGQESLRNGIATKNFWALDISKRENKSTFAWKELNPWPGPSRLLPVVSGQSDGTDECLYVFSGYNSIDIEDKKILADAYKYNPVTAKWSVLSNILFCKESAPSVLPAPGIASGANHILLFRKEILSYHTITDTWVGVGQMPPGDYLTSIAIQWNESFIITSTEIYLNTRSLRVWKATPHLSQNFGFVNYTILIVYLISLVGLGLYFWKREKSTDDFFKASGRIPWWASGLSIFGTQLSAITFMAIPAKTFASDWRYFMLNMTIVVVAPLIIYLFLPFFRRLNITTAYEYLEKRFNLLTRLIGSFMFISFQLSRIGIILFLPSIVLSVILGVDVHICIIVMAVLSITYTVLGGIEAVIWTDVLQVFVLLGGALLCLILIPFSIEGGVSSLINLAREGDKFFTFDFRFDLTTPTFWVVVFGGLASNLISYGSDQTVIQRYLTTKDEKSAAKGIWTNGILTIPATVIFFGIGTALFVFYKSYPQFLNPIQDNTDAIFPWYIVTQLPPGIAGLLIAAIFAAAMSSLDSSMNSVATAITTDFYRRFNPTVDDSSCLRIARWITVIVGLSGLGFALIMAGWDIQSLWDQLNTFIGLFVGGLGGLFILGIFCRRAHGIGAVIGLIVCSIVQFIVKEMTPISFLLYSFTGMISCVIVGYVSSLLISTKRKSIKGLTIYTRIG